MKHLFPIFIAAILAGCAKTETPVSETNAVRQSNSNARLTVDFNYTLTKDANGEYSCPTPKTDCSKIRPENGIAATVDAAIAGRRVQQFFNTPGWETDFPYLAGQPQLISHLQDGTYTMLRETNSNGDLFYIVARASDGVAIYTTMVENSGK
ncbi:MAG: hypothetical protein MUC87_02590 [Bacteroidia bacterium]|jgi:hypothetical protein|nr:hypothetical protein [Bacteroidia bacterium]